MVQPTGAADQQRQPPETYTAPQGAVPGLRPGEGAMRDSGGAPHALGEGLPRTRESHRGGKRTGTGTTEDAPGAAGAVPGLRPGEGATGEGLPRTWGGHRGGNPPGGNNE